MLHNRPRPPSVPDYAHLRDGSHPVLLRVRLCGQRAEPAGAGPPPDEERHQHGTGCPGRVRPALPAPRFLLLLPAPVRAEKPHSRGEPEVRHSISGSVLSTEIVLGTINAL